jgi:hypothetical protein
MKKTLIITLLLLGQQTLAMNGATEEDRRPQLSLLDQWAPVVPAPRAGDPLLEQWMPEATYNRIHGQVQRQILSQRLFAGVTLMNNQ